jgi:hypothetical protein
MLIRAIRMICIAGDQFLLSTSLYVRKDHETLVLMEKCSCAGTRCQRTQTLGARIQRKDLAAHSARFSTDFFLPGDFDQWGKL